MDELPGDSHSVPIQPMEYKLAVGNGGLPTQRFWARLSNRTKAIIVIDLALLAVVAAAGTIYLLHARHEAATSSSDAQPTTPQTSTPPEQPFRTSHGFAWIVAACGGPMVIDDLPEPPLPRASHSGICLTSPGSLLVTIGVYETERELRADVEAIDGAHRYAIRTDDTDLTWLFVVEGPSSEPLASLAKYDFQIV